MSILDNFYFQIVTGILAFFYFFHQHSRLIRQRNQLHAHLQALEEEEKQEIDVDKLKESLSESTFVVKQESIGKQWDEECQEEEEQLFIPPLCSNAARCASLSCAICLDNYKVGDSVVCSSDPTCCKHVFHEDCILPWFLASKDSSCPTCRQSFINISGN